MATYALVHGAGDVGWYWHLVERELRARGHSIVAPDLPIEDDDASLLDNAQVVLDAIEVTHEDGELVVVDSRTAATSPRSSPSSRRPIG